MSITKTPAQARESHRITRQNGTVSGLGHELKSSEKLDRRFHTKESWDTRKTAQKLSDALWARDAVERELKSRLSSLRSSPRDKAHATEQLKKIEASKSRERRDRIIGRASGLTTRQRNTAANGILRLKP